MSTRTELGARERQIADIVTRLGSATAQEVREQLPDPPTYSAVRGMLRLLESKGVLAHRTEGLKYVYYTSVPRERARLDALSHLVNVYFDGLAHEAAEALLDASDRRLSKEQFERLRKLIERKAPKSR